MDEILIDRQALVETFVAEADEILVQLEQVLLALESRPEDDELLHALFRSAHTLKGSASTVGFDAVSELAHQLEDVLGRVRARTLVLNDALVTLMLESVDVLRSAVADAAAGVEKPSELVERFRARLGQASSAATAERGRASGPAEPGAVFPAHAAGSGNRTLRVDVRKLDRMLDLSGEIAIARGRLTDMLERRQSGGVEEILAAHRETDRLYFDLQELIIQARMVPVGPVFQQQIRPLRDAAAGSGKQVRLEIEGEDVELDTAVVEHIRDPLMHMVRNAVDHGIEPPDVRRARGKDPCGRVLLRAHHEAGSIVVEVNDDGGGLARRRIAERAEALGLVADADALTEAEVAHLVFEPGLTTSDTVTEISGRGVGMDVVRRNVEALRGSVSVESEDGNGTAITLRLPLTLAIIQGFRVGVGEEIYILPLDAVVECLELPVDARRDGDAGILDLRGVPLPYLRLRRQFAVPGEPPAREHVVVVQHAGATAGVAVDALLGESQTVIKPLGKMLRATAGVSGSSILGDGRVALVLEVPGLLREALKRAAAVA